MGKEIEKDTDKGMDKDTGKDKDTDTDKGTDMELEYFCYICIYTLYAICIYTYTLYVVIIVPNGLLMTHHSANSNGAINLKRCFPMRITTCRF